MGTGEGVREAGERDVVDGGDWDGGVRLVAVEPGVLENVLGVLGVDGLEGGEELRVGQRLLHF